MIHKTSDGASSRVDYHVLVKVHEIITLIICQVNRLRHESQNAAHHTHIVILVNCSHSSFALSLSDDLSRVFHDDLVRFESPIAADAITAVFCLDNLDTYIVFASSLGSLLEFFEAAVSALGT